MPRMSPGGVILSTIASAVLVAWFLVLEAERIVWEMGGRFR